VVAVADLAFPDRFPFIDLEAGGTVAGYIATLAELAGEYPQETRFVAAHGAAYSAPQLAAYGRELAAMGEKVRSAVAAGATVEKMQADKVLGAWPEWGASYVTADRFIATLAAARRQAPALPSVLDRLIATLVKGSGEDAVKLYRALAAQRPPAYAFSEAEINQLGYALLTAKRTDDAIAVLALNAEEHPDSWNAHDSLGEAYMTAGKREPAIASYTRSLELNPANETGKQALERLRAR